MVILMLDAPSSPVEIDSMLAVALDHRRSIAPEAILDMVSLFRIRIEGGEWLPRTPSVPRFPDGVILTLQSDPIIFPL
jgi:hypothetical protein